MFAVAVIVLAGLSQIYEKGTFGTSAVAEPVTRLEQFVRAEAEDAILDAHVNAQLIAPSARMQKLFWVHSGSDADHHRYFEHYHI